MGLTAKPTGKFRGILDKIKLDEMKRKEEKNRDKSNKKN